MASPKLEIRLSKIMHAYLEDLAAIGYGKDKSAVARRFIENAVTAVLEKSVMEKRKAKDFQDGNEDED